MPGSAKPAATSRAPEKPLEEVIAHSRREWRAWLAAHHEQAESIWLVHPKKASGSDLTYDALVEEALCFGWIDSVARGRDEAMTMIRMSPRKRGSGWSKTNKVRIERLVADGRMTPAGLAKIDAAKRDGSWTALDAAEALEIPDDLARAFRRNAKARKQFESFPPGARKMIIAWVTGAKRPETRANRVAETVRQAAEGRRANQG
jgi:uncharacterized protein YdeI (YjbR/CyaY-like superfamily)